LNSLADEFVEYIAAEQPTAVRYIPQIIVEVAHYQSQRLLVIDPVISLLACIYKLQLIINGTLK
jgi:hypothetical protein